MYRHLVEQFDLLAYPIAALLIFVAVFLLILTRALRPSRDLAALASLPLDLESGDPSTASSLSPEHDHAAR